MAIRNSEFTPSNEPLSSIEQHSDTFLDGLEIDQRGGIDVTKPYKSIGFGAIEGRLGLHALHLASETWATSAPRLLLVQGVGGWGSIEQHT